MVVEVPSSTEGWAVLHRKVRDSILTHSSPQVQQMLLAMSIFCPVTAVLYVVSGVKRSRETGTWLVKFDANGYMRPNAHTLIPVLVVVYTVVNIASLITFQIDLYSYIKPHTTILHLTTFPILVSLGWTKLWIVLYSMPPSRYDLVKMRGGPSDKFLSARISNCLIIAVYLLPFLVTIPLLSIAISQMSSIRKSWVEFEHFISVIVDPNSKDSAKSVSELNALRSLKYLEERARKMLVVHRGLSGCYLCFAGILLLGIVYAHFRILRALFFQVDLLQQASHRRQALRLDDYVESRKTNRTSLRTRSETVETLQGDETSISTFFSPPDRTSIYRRRYQDWLPNLKRGTGVDVDLWKSSLFTRGKQEWESLDEAILAEQSRVLRSYTSNTLWQAVLATVFTVSYMVLDSIVVCFIRLLQLVTFYGSQKGIHCFS